MKDTKLTEEIKYLKKKNKILSKKYNQEKAVRVRIQARFDALELQLEKERSDNISKLKIKTNRTRQLVLDYLKSNPEATMRVIQKACQLSTVSLVKYHLDIIKTNNLICK